MLKHFYLLLLATFTIGFFTGFYVYFAGWRPIEFPQIHGPEHTYTIVADEYGGCARIESCKSFRILSDGSYDFIDGSGSTAHKYTGTLDRPQQETLAEVFNSTDFAVLASSTAGGGCATQFDGIEYRYTITADQIYYRFDTCEQDLDGAMLFQDLEDYFIDFTITHSE